MKYLTMLRFTLLVGVLAPALIYSEVQASLNKHVGESVSAGGVILDRISSEGNDDIIMAVDNGFRRVLTAAAKKKPLPKPAKSPPPPKPSPKRAPTAKSPSPPPTQRPSSPPPPTVVNSPPPPTVVNSPPPPTVVNSPPPPTVVNSPPPPSVANSPPPPSVVNSPPPPPETPAATCADINSNCDFWKNNGYCNSYYQDPCLVIKDYWCPRSCGTCGGAPLVSESPKAGGCVDADAAFDLHNTYRARHATPALVWNNTLANNALTYARTLARAGCPMTHDTSNTADGENLFGMYGGSGTFALNCSKGVKAWYDEIQDYLFTSTPYTSNRGKMIGHFTQVVWKSTTSVGCGAAAGSSCYVVVCRYSPPGNYMYDCFYNNNVLPLTSSG